MSLSSGSRPSTTPLSRPGGATGSTSRLGAASPLAGMPRTTSDPRGLASSILVLCRWIQNAVIGIWMGALITVGAIVAPKAFAALKTPAAAGAIVGPSVLRVTEMGGICGMIYLLMLLIHDPLWKRYHPTASNALLSFLKTILAAAMVGAAGYLLYRVTGKLDHYQAVAHVVNGHLAGGAGRAFDYWHRLYEQITYGIFGAGLFLLLLTQMAGRRR